MATAGLGYKGRAGAKPKQIVYCFISEAKRRPDLFPRRRSIVSGSLERERERAVSLSSEALKYEFRSNKGFDRLTQTSLDFLGILKHSQGYLNIFILFI